MKLMLIEDKVTCQCMHDVHCCSSIKWADLYNNVTSYHLASVFWKKKGKVKGQANYKYTHVRMDLFSCETVAMTKWASEFNIQVGE